MHPSISPPSGDGQTGLKILQGMLRDRSLLTALSLMRKYVGNAFQIPLPGFKPVVMAGPESNRKILVTERGKLRWRNEGDPVTKLLRNGVLVVDGEQHDELRAQMEPDLQRRHVYAHIPVFWKDTERVCKAWADGNTYDMLVEMRKIALLILFGALFRVDFFTDLDRMWGPILDLIKMISPGPWILFPGMPLMPRYRRARQVMDAYLYDLIHRRRSELAGSPNAEASEDLLSHLVSSQQMNDDLIRDQLLTMLIAGHDTSTALLAWALYLLGDHPEIMKAVQNEVDNVLTDPHEVPNTDQLDKMVLLDQVIKEALRLYPPIHVGNRKVVQELTLQGYKVPAGERLMCSIYLSHRDPEHWQDADEFKPERFDHRHPEKPPAFTYLPFGGGPRNCIGAAFAQVESKVVLSRLLHHYDLELLNADEIVPYMGATLEPRPGVLMRVHKRAT